MNLVKSLEKGEAEALIDFNGIQAASRYLDHQSLPYPITTIDAELESVKTHTRLLESLVLQCDARNVLDEPNDINREFDWIEYARKYLCRAAKIKKESVYWVKGIRFFHSGRADVLGDLFEDTIRSLNCDQNDAYDTTVYPYRVAIGEVALRGDI